ncbi:MAG: ABC transporter ATP-binding protein [Lachnospiraceae bacterium]|nr:ABC transporter ATP-binding protein [Lachnospiraceae bacterium]
MNNALSISGLTKTYADFTLDGVSFDVPVGSIVGLIGENGAGKSTTINAVLGLIQKEAGHVSLLGKDTLDNETKEQIGVVFDGSNYPEILSPRKIDRIMKNVYDSWDESSYFRLLEQFSLPPDKPIKQFSKGMKMKLAITAALSHHSKLLILDEATSGLDPVIRDDILDMLLDFVQEEDHSILVSSHITGDLEKIADYIVFIHEGKVVFSKPKDELMEQYGLIKCGAAQFDALDPSDIIAYRKMDYEWQVLVSDRDAMQKKYPKALIVPTTIDEIMLLYVKGTTQKQTTQKGK